MVDTLISPVDTATSARLALGNEESPETSALDSQSYWLQDTEKQTSETRWKWFVLFTACLMSLGSHYGSYLLGPLKKRLSEHLHTNNAQFSLLIASFSLNSTWTPLVTGLLISRIGVTKSAVIATGVICAGQAVLYLGHAIESVHTMAIGLFMFGLTISPLSVCQESLIYHLYTSPEQLSTVYSQSGSNSSSGHHHTNFLLGLALLLGKFASFLAALTTVPLADTYGESSPFAVSLCLCVLSFTLALALWIRQRSMHESPKSTEINDVPPSALVVGSGEPAAPLISSPQFHTAEEYRDIRKAPPQLTMEERVGEKKRIRFRSLTKLGDAFWWYIFVNILSGCIWQPFIHLSTHIIEVRYQMTEERASAEASILLSGAVILYPIVGFLSDALKSKKPTFPLMLFFAASVLVAFCYFWLNLKPLWTKSAVPGLAGFAVGHGMSTQYISTALGLHKSIEMAGSTISQSIAGLILDIEPLQKAPHPIDIPHSPTQPGSTTLDALLSRASGRKIKGKAARQVLRIYLTIAIIQTMSAWVLNRFVSNRLRKTEPTATASPLAEVRYQRLPQRSRADSLLSQPSEGGMNGLDEDPFDPAVEADNMPPSADTTSRAEQRRGRVGLVAAMSAIALAWLVFWTTAVIERF